MVSETSKIQAQDEFVYTSCNLCNSEDFTFLFSGRDYLFYSPDTFNVVQCNQCGLVFLNPHPQNIGQYYRDYHRGELHKDAFTWLSPDKSKRIKKLKKSGRILDVGCGRGNFLLAMQKAGWEVYGNDISLDACEYVKNELELKNIYNGHLLSLDLSAAFFDVITLWHVLEHLEKPRETLEYINRLLKDDGVLVIESPDFTSLQSKFFKKNWYALDLPRHLFQFSPMIVKKMLIKARFEIYGKDFFIDPRMSFIFTKMSTLRWLGKQHPPQNGKRRGDGTVSSYKKRKLSWRFSRFLFNWVNLLLAFFLNSINCKDMFRVYCRKMKKV